MVDPKKCKYKNITISGYICTGTSTLSSLLIEKLKWKHWNVGQFQRDYCKKQGLKLENTYDRPDERERSIEYGMRKDLKEKDGQLMEAWLSGFVAQGVDGVLKVLLTCDDSLRVDRYVNREGVLVKEAKRLLKKREIENAKKWTRVYEKEWGKWIDKKDQGLKTAEGYFDFWNPKFYDLVIDTFSNSREETLKEVLDKLEKGK